MDTRDNYVPIRVLMKREMLSYLFVHLRTKMLGLARRFTATSVLAMLTLAIIDLLFAWIFDFPLEKLVGMYLGQIMVFLLNIAVLVFWPLRQDLLMQAYQDYRAAKIRQRLEAMVDDFNCRLPYPDYRVLMLPKADLHNLSALSLAIRDKRLPTDLIRLAEAILEVHQELTRLQESMEIDHHEEELT